MTVEIGTTQKYFNLAEAKELLPIIRHLTEQHRKQLEPIQFRLDKMLSNDPRRPTIDIEFEAVVSGWKTKVEQLGVLVKGLWLVEFDVIDGYLGWQYPNRNINFFRDKKAKLNDRIRLSRHIEDVDPEWA